MEPDEYPMLIPPGHLSQTPVKAWSKGEADEYAAWLQSSLEDRTGNLLSFLRLSSDGSPDEVLEAAGRAVAGHLRSGPPFSDGTTLSDRGRALAADLGLLSAMLLLRDAPVIRWQVVRRPKSDMSYNLPVLVGFTNGLHLDPVGGSIAEASGLLRGNKGPDAWKRIYQWWIDKT